MIYSRIIQRLGNGFTYGFNKFFVPANRDHWLRFLNEAFFNITEEEIHEAARKSRTEGNK
jgi:hypothetical protein